MAITIEALKALGVKFSADNLTIIKVPRSAIGESGFFEIPNSVTKIGDFLFEGRTSLAEVVIGNSVTRIGSRAFKGCTGLIEVVIPNSVTRIGYSAFYGCTGLTEVVIPNSVTTIGSWAFRGCTGLRKVVMPNNITRIGYSAFYGCTGLTEVVIPNSVTSIEDLAFKGCTGLTEVVIPNSVTRIGDEAFEGCDNLNVICIDTDDDAELARITALLPDNLRDKVVSRTRYDALVDRKQQIIKKYLAVLCKNPKTNPAYQFFTDNNIFPLGENDISQNMNTIIGEDNPYIKQALQQMSAQALPRTDDEFIALEEECRKIVSKQNLLASIEKRSAYEQALSERCKTGGTEKTLRMLLPDLNRCRPKSSWYHSHVAGDLATVRPRRLMCR